MQNNFHYHNYNTVKAVIFNGTGICSVKRHQSPLNKSCKIPVQHTYKETRFHPHKDFHDRIVKNAVPVYRQVFQWKIDRKSIRIKMTGLIYVTNIISWSAPVVQFDLQKIRHKSQIISIHLTEGILYQMDSTSRRYFCCECQYIITWSIW